ncbi:hypothetical protein QGX12_gp031 [Pseudomonas phage Kremar]|uniref:Uncharacterized protein n=1 Tax=Pseudomonas phage Kremar TaxID=2928831 RepID=A0AAE9KES2_9CAUD|nr:hypothetical protein QGX12_gp031 [Pseudomonas phage Kremar]UOL48454.1 hypothetical protein [Pseudomonas phage Kremar]
MKQTVYVVTGLELGWDCVCGVHRTFESALRYIFNDVEHKDMTVDELEELYDEGDSSYIIHDERLED